MKTSPSILIVHDNALLRAFERPTSEKPSTERMGHYLENAVGARFIEAGWETYYWKDKNHEFDFIVLGPNGEKWAVEVKSKAPSENELKGLNYFRRTHPEFEPILICPEEIQSSKMRSLLASDNFQ